MNSLITIKTKYDVTKKLGSNLSGIELTRIHDVGKVTIADIKRQRYDIENNPLSDVMIEMRSTSDEIITIKTITMTIL